MKLRRSLLTVVVLALEIVHIEGAGHNVRRENKAQTIEVMKAFLSGT